MDKSPGEFRMTDRNYEYLIEKTYKTNNYFAYFFDIGDKDRLDLELKYYNFVPSYDKWCLFCGKTPTSQSSSDDVKTNKRCSKCKSVFYCSIECQKKSYSVHKQHCGRDLFTVCITCGKDINDDCKKDCLKCDKCPVKYCSKFCKENIEDAHKEIDCGYFSQIF